jgi:hypothetical protein
MKVLGLLLSFVVVMSGCSVFALRAPDPTRKPGVDVACTVDNYAPAMDVSLVASSAGAAVAYEEARVPALLGVAMFIGSAIYGYSTTAKCARSKDEAYAYHAALLERIGDTPIPPPQRRPAAAAPKPRPTETADDEER